MQKCFYLVDISGIIEFEEALMEMLERESIFNRSTLFYNFWSSFDWKILNKIKQIIKWIVTLYKWQHQWAIKNVIFRLVWLDWLSVVLCTKRFLTLFAVKAHSWVPRSSSIFLSLLKKITNKTYFLKKNVLFLQTEMFIKH